MKVTFWIGCILIVLLSGVSLCMAADGVENNTEAVVETIVEPVSNVTNVNETPNETNLSTTQNTTETEVVIPEAVPTVQVTAEPTAETTPEVAIVNETNVTPVEVPQVAEVTSVDQIKKELETFVSDARMIALKAGKDAAISAFNDRMGPYADPKMSVFAYDINGNVLANPMDLNLVGRNQISSSDPEGTRYVQMMIDTAKNGGGFVEYLDSNILNQGKMMKKVVYVKSVDGSWFVGSGIFLEEEPEQKENTQPATSEIISQEIPVNSTASV